jgi:hypothetical protein
LRTILIGVMFALFKSRRIIDPELGELVRSRRYWRGNVLIATQSIPIAISGTKDQPDARALSMARQIPHQYASWRVAIATALFEHYKPYADALAAGVLPQSPEPLPRISEVDQAWAHASLIFVLVSPLDDVLTVELGYTSAWDEEHILGARFRDNNFMQLCGSVVNP